MIMVEESDDIEYQTFISFDLVYNHDDHTENTTFSFVFDVHYTEAPVPDSDEKEVPDYDTLRELTVRRTHVCDKDWLIGGNKAQIKSNLRQILEMVDVPCYKDIVKQLTREIMVLKNRDANNDLPKVERIDVGLDLVVYSLPDNLEQYVVHDHVRSTTPVA